MYLSFMDLGMALGSSILGLVAGALGYRAIYGVSLISLVALLLVYTLAYGRKSQAPQAKEA